MKKALFALFTFLIFSATSFAQLTGEIETRNDSIAINDGVMIVKVQGGTPPYTYYWAGNKGAYLDKDTARGFTEGIDYTVVVTDANGQKLELTDKVETIAFGESLNGAFVPVVGAIESVLMFDLFSALGKDDNIYNDAGEQQFHNNGDPKKQKTPMIVIWLVLGAIIFTFRMKFINFWGVRHALDLVRGRYDDPNEDEGEVSHFQALTTALSGTVGLGNIAGVAIAVSTGGAGATFWMIVAGLLGMASKFVECTLGVKYREIDEDGEVFGGPMYYLKKGLKKKGMGGLGIVLAMIFALLCIGGSFGGGNMFQANQAFEQLNGVSGGYFNGQGVWFGLIFAVLVGVVIIGGIKSIAKVTDKIVPFMVGIYVLFALIIIFANIANIGDAFYAIFDGAFNAEALKGGVLGVLVIGFQRAAFSNEAGVGSASIAHSAVKTKEPVSEGVVALLEPFIDTVVVCTMTALVIIFTGYVDNEAQLDGAQLTSAAFSSGGFDWFKYVLTFAIVLFAFSTMISWSYYGQQATAFLFTNLFGEKVGKSNGVAWGYKIVFCLFVILGASSSLGAVIGFSDLMVLGMAFPNILGLYFLLGEVRKDAKDYFGRIKSGAIKRYK